MTVNDAAAFTPMPTTDEPDTAPRTPEMDRAAKISEADQMMAAIKEFASDMVDQANRSTNAETATQLGVVAVDLFDQLDKFGKSVMLALNSAPDPAEVDLVALHQAIMRKHPEAFIPGQAPYHATPPMHQWTCEDTLIELRGAKPRKLPMLRPIPSGTELTISDFFAGAGGSSSGLRMVPGLTVKLAVNHWDLAIETHNYNHPDTDHDQASLARTDPSRYPYTDLAWFSPECTFWSVARGDKCDYDEGSEQLALDLMDDDDDSPEAKEAKWRSRMLMRDVVRFSRHHQYKAVIVENVPDILKWAAMDRWLAEMVAEGYRYKILTLNSAFAGATGASAPQLRDRVYVVFWKSCYKTPNWNKWLRPKAWCPGCTQVVEAIYNPKPGGRRPMRYGPKAQYTYRCPKKACHGIMVQPLVRPAGSVIDWSLPTQRIGGRKRPLAKKTRDRVAAGVARFFNAPMITPAGGCRSNTSTPLSQPTQTLTTTESRALVVPMEGRGPVSSIRRTDELFRTQSTRAQDALVELPGEAAAREAGFLHLFRSGRERNIGLNEPLATTVADGSGHALIQPDSFIAPLRNNGSPEETTRPFRTFAANGNHHALVMRNNHGGAEMSTPIGEPIRTLTTAGHQSLIEHPEADHALYAYDTGNLRPLSEPMPSQTTVEGDALIGGGRFVDVDDCTLRMLAVHEVQAGMSFDDDYVLLGKAKRNKIKMLGNAVTPPSSRDLGACVMEAITGVDIPRYDENPQLWLPN